ncbi:hypothetical protein AB0J72_05645 [Dactylosporangium sp. NPDC049742]|uniref:hypothetical protein n=1 Tax=Dactylosporangium sp. NPDC049742 TaxID=3154737 RepID=UPI00342F2CBD
MTSLPSPAFARPWRAGTVPLAVAVALVLAWLTAALIWGDGWSTSVRAEALMLPPVLFTGSTLGYLTWSLARSRPVAFEVRDGAFVVPPADQLSAAFATSVLAGATASAGMLMFDRSEDWLGEFVATWYICLALTAATFVLRLLIRARRTGRMLLRPEGLLITYAYGSREIPWEAVSGGPPRTGLTDPRLRIGRPDLVRATGLARRGAVKAFLPTGDAWVRREFLTDAINYYLAVPAAQQSIGTAEGYVHLRRVLRA